jgi:hypothetical protein
MARLRSTIALAALVFVAAGAAQAANSSGYSRWPKVRLAGFSVGVGYSHFSGGYPGFGYPYYGFGYPFYGFAYSPFLYDPLFYSVPPAYFYQDTLGKVKIEGAEKDAAIYLDGGFAGTAGKLKDMWVEPGVHDLRVTSQNHTYERRIYVLTGKTLKIAEGIPDGNKP